MRGNGTYTNPYLLELGGPKPSHVAMDADPMVFYEILKPNINLAIWVPPYPAIALNYLAHIGQGNVAPDKPWFESHFTKGSHDPERYTRIHANSHMAREVSIYEQVRNRFAQALPYGQGRQIVANTLGEATAHFSQIAQCSRLHLSYRIRKLKGQSRWPGTIHTDPCGYQMLSVLNEEGMRIVSSDSLKLNIKPTRLRFNRPTPHPHLTWAKLRGHIWEIPTPAIFFMKGHGFLNPAAHEAPPRPGQKNDRPERICCFAFAARGRYSANMNYYPRTSTVKSPYILHRD
jgi:hypothetical protein